MSDRPDYTLPVSIEGYTIASLPIDIKAQSVGNIAITIAAQTLTNLNVNITNATIAVTGTVAISGTVTVSGTVAISGDVTVKGAVTVSGSVSISGSVTITGTVIITSGTVTFTNTTIAVTGSVSVSGTVAISGSVTITGAVTITSGTVTFTNTTIAVTGSVTVSGTVAISGTVTVSGTVAISGSVTITGTVIITSGTVTFTNTTIAVTGSVTVSGTVAVSGTVTVSGSVTVSGTVAISGSVTVTGAVTVTGSVTISGAVTITSGAVTISTAAGTNIVLDVLTQGAYAERRSTLSNSGAVTAWAAYNGALRGGKYFPRGCRGFMKTIDVYCRDIAATGGTLTVYVAPSIGSGQIASAIVTIPAGGAEAWRSATLSRMWQYDSMFIWFVASTADLEVGYDTTAPFDFWFSADSGVTWAAIAGRFAIRAIVEGETAGDVPVSGTVNNIEIPSAVTSRKSAALFCPLSTEVLDTIQYGTGKTIIVYFYCLTANSYAMLIPRIYCDGASILPYDINLAGWFYNVELAKSDIYFGKLDTTGNMYTLVVALKYPFKRSLQIGFYNSDAANANQGYVSYSYEKIS